MRDAGALRDNTVVATVMSNLGFHHAMRDAGIDGRHDRGRRPLRAGGAARQGPVLGGEQSGHVVFTDAATTGDGLLTALHVMAWMANSGRPLAELASVVRRLPQVLVNVPVADRAAACVAAAVVEARARRRGRTRRHGRVLLRPSGTEQLVRVMVEAATQQRADEIAQRVAAVVASN